MPTELYYSIAGVVTYLVGAIPFGWLFVWLLKKVDIREVGSKNIGATNASRVLGGKWFFPIFALDFLKGFAPVFWLAPFVANQWPCEH